MFVFCYIYRYSCKYEYENGVIMCYTMYLIDYSNMLCQLILTFMSFILLTFWNTRYVVYLANHDESFILKCSFDLGWLHSFTKKKHFNRSPKALQRQEKSGVTARYSFPIANKNLIWIGNTKVNVFFIQYTNANVVLFLYLMCRVLRHPF